VTPSRLLALAGLLAAALWSAGHELGAEALPAPADVETPAAPTEYQVKAAFLYSFAKFVQWPDDAFGKPEGPFVVGVLGDDPFGAVLDQTLERPVGVVDYLTLAWLISSLATVGGAIGSGLEDEQAVRAVAYGYHPEPVGWRDEGNAG